MMYHGQPDVTDLPGPKKYRINQYPNKWFGYLDSKGRWWIPRDGEQTDQATMLLWFQALLGVADDEFWAFYIHDYGCDYLCLDVYSATDGIPDLNHKIGEVKVTRKDVDDILLEAMLYENSISQESIPIWKIYAIYGAVRGWYSILSLLR